MELLLDAHLEGLRVAQLESAEAGATSGLAAWSASKSRVSRWGTVDESFVAGMLAMEGLEVGTATMLDELQTLAQAQIEGGRGNAIAVGLGYALAARPPGVLSERVVTGWWSTASAPWQLAAVIASRGQSTLRDRFILESLNGPAELPVALEATRVAADFGMTEAIAGVRGAMNRPSSPTELRIAAAAAIGRLTVAGSASGADWTLAEAILMEAAMSRPEMLSDEELAVLLWRAPPGATHTLIEQLLRDGGQDRRRWREAIRAIRIQGDARWIPVLLNCIEHQSGSEELKRVFAEPASNLARLAGDVYAHITGARIAHQRWRDAPEDDSEDEDDVADNPYVPASAKRDPDGALLWPDPVKLTAEWGAIASDFEPGRRYLCGEAVTESSLLRVLGNAKASQQQRAQASLLLQIARGGVPCMNVGAPTQQQDRHLESLGATSWNW